jgi:hypothetical protein
MKYPKQPNEKEVNNMSDLTVKKLICDNCEKELIIESKYPAKFALELKAINVGKNSSGVTYAVAVYPPIDDSKHFCNINCLSEWAIKIKRGV